MRFSRDLRCRSFVWSLTKTSVAIAQIANPKKKKSLAQGSDVEFPFQRASHPLNFATVVVTPYFLPGAQRSKILDLSEENRGCSSSRYWHRSRRRPVPRHLL